MKRNFLLMLLLTLLPLAGWADKTVDVGSGYQAILADGVKLNNGLPYVLPGEGLPEVTGFTIGGQSFSNLTYVPTLTAGSTANYNVVKHNGELFFPQANNADADNALALGNYYLEFRIVNNEQVTKVYVPFQVYGNGAGKFAYVYDDESYASAIGFGDVPNSALVQYYNANPWSDLGAQQDQAVNSWTLYQPQQQAWWITAGNYERRLEWWNEESGTTGKTYGQVEIENNSLVRNFQTAVRHPKYNGNSQFEGFPWIVPFGFSTSDDPVKLLFMYDKENNSTVYPWGTTAFGGSNGKLWGVASVAFEFQEPSWGIPETDPNKDISNGFNINKFKMLLVPATTPTTIAPTNQARQSISGGRAEINQITYNKEEQKPIFFAGSNAGFANARVYPTSNSDEALAEGTDFTVTYPDADYTSAGTKNITITGIGLYSGTLNATYTISKYGLDSDDFELDDDDYVAGETLEIDYTGSDVKPTVIGTSGLEFTEGDDPVVVEGDLVEGTDYTTELWQKGEGSNADTKLDGDDGKKAVNVGKYYWKITPKGNYTTSENEAITLNFEVVAKKLNGFVVILPESYTYNTKEQKPVFKDVAATADAEAIAADAWVLPSMAGDTPTDAEKEKALEEGVDYIVEYPYDEDNEITTDYVKVGRKPIVITGRGNYTGNIGGSAQEPTFGAPEYEIVAKDIASNDVHKELVNVKYTGQELALVQSNFNFFYNNDNPLQLGTDFTWELVYPEGMTEEEREQYATSAGSKEIKVSGNGNYYGNKVIPFSMAAYQVTITPANLTKIYGDPDPAPNFTVDAGSATFIEYGGEEWEYIQGFLEVERAAVDPSNAEDVKENVGSHQYIIKPKAATLEDCNYEIVIQNSPGSLTIYPAPLTVTIAQNTKVYSGDPATDPNFTADKGDNKFKITRPSTSVDGDPVDVTNAKDFGDELRNLAEKRNLKDVLNIGRVEGEDVDGPADDDTYPFTWNNPNYEVTFEPTGFTITPKSIGITVSFNEVNTTYQGKVFKPIPKVTRNDTGAELVNEKDFSVEHFEGENGNNLRDVTKGTNQAGNRWPHVTVSQVAKGNFTFTAKENQYYQITPATLKIAAIADNSKAYGDADPTPLSQVTFAAGYGPVGDDYYDYNEDGSLHNNFSFNPVLLKREEGDHVGNYEIYINPQAATRNYIIEGTPTANFHIYRSGYTFVISFDKLTPGNNTTTITYDDPFGDNELKGLVKVQAPTGYTGNLTADLLAYAKENVKKYQIDEETGDKVYVDDYNVGTYILDIDDAPTTFANYDVWVQKGELKVQPFPLYIIANATKEYGAEDPELTWDVYEKQIVNNEETYVLTEREDFEVPQARYIGNSDATLTDLWRYTISRADGENVGEYSTHIRNSRRAGALGQRTEYYNTQLDGNYSFKFQDGIFKITRRNLAVTVTGNSKFYGEYDPVKELKWLEPRTEDEEDDNIEMYTNGLVRIQIENALRRDVRNIASLVNYDYRAAGEVASKYQVFQVTFDGVTQPVPDRLDNYNLTFTANNVNFSIDKRVLKVTAHDQSVPYANPLVVDPFDLTITEGILLNNEYQGSTNVNYDSEVTVMRLLNSQTPVINDKVTDVFKPLEVAEGKTAVGVFHKDAFDLELTDAAKQNYTLEFTNGKLYIEQLNDIYLDMANLPQVLSDHQKRTVTVHLPGRSMKANDWYSWVLPFDVKQRDFFRGEGTWGYGAMETLDEAKTTDKTVSFRLTVQPIDANTPFIVKVDEDITEAQMKEIKFPGVQIAEFDYLNENPASGSENTVQFIGVYNATQPGDLDASALTLRRYSKELPSSQWSTLPLEWWPANSNVVVRCTYGYLQFPSAEAASEAKIYIQEPDGTYTAINGVAADGIISEGEAVYNLSGQRVSKAQKGILIKDGKKILVK